MSFKIINPGFGYLVDPEFSTIYSSIYNPQNGVSCWCRSNSGYKGYTIPALGRSGTLFFKFDIFMPREGDGNYSALLGLGNSDYYHAWLFIGIDLEFDYYYLELVDMYGSSPIAISNEDNGDFFELGAVNTVWVSLRLEDEFNEDSSCTVKVNGKTVAECKNFDTSAFNQTIFVIEVSEKTPVSNLIISDEYIDPDENIFRVRSHYGVSTTFMDYNGSGYARTFEDEQWWTFKDWGELYQDLKAKNLYSAVGSDGTVTGMTAIASPAFFTGIESTTYPPTGDTENSRACCFVGLNYEERTDYPRQNVSSDTGAALIQDLPVTSDTTFASLNGMRVGWRVELGSV